MSSVLVHKYRRNGSGQGIYGNGRFGRDLFRGASNIPLMKILRTLARVCTTSLDETVLFYENLTGTITVSRFGMPTIGLELAVVQDILIIGGTEDTLRPFRPTSATLLVDSLDEYHRFLTAHGAAIIRPPQVVPTGRNMIVRHPDGSIVEYVEHTTR